MTAGTFPTLPDIATREQVASYLQVSVTTLDRWVAKGDDEAPRVSRIGRFIRFRKEDVLDWVERQCARG